MVILKFFFAQRRQDSLIIFWFENYVESLGAFADLRVFARNTKL